MCTLDCRVRDDKKPEDASGPDDVVALFLKQANIASGAKAAGRGPGGPQGQHQAAAAGAAAGDDEPAGGSSDELGGGGPPPPRKRRRSSGPTEAGESDEEEEEEGEATDADGGES